MWVFIRVLVGEPDYGEDSMLHMYRLLKNSQSLCRIIRLFVFRDGEVSLQRPHAGYWFYVCDTGETVKIFAGLPPGFLCNISSRYIDGDHGQGLPGAVLSGAGN